MHIREYGVAREPVRETIMRRRVDKKKYEEDTDTLRTVEEKASDTPGTDPRLDLLYRGPVP